MPSVYPCCASAADGPICATKPSCRYHIARCLCQYFRKHKRLDPKCPATSNQLNRTGSWEHSKAKPRAFSSLLLWRPAPLWVSGQDGTCANQAIIVVPETLALTMICGAIETPSNVQ